MQKEKFSYPYNHSAEMRDKLEDIQHLKRFKTIRETIDYAINEAHKEVIKCTKSKQ